MDMLLIGPDLDLDARGVVISRVVPGVAGW